MLVVAPHYEANPFGQPAEVVVERYTRDGVRLLSTDQYGEVTLQINGNNLDVFTFAGSDARVSGEAGGVEGLLVP